MAQLSKNSPLYGAKGKIGDIVFRTRNGKTYLAKAPAKRKAKPTVQQSAARDKFAFSSLYAKAAISIPEIKESYELAATDGRSAFNVAFADSFNAPKVKDIDTSNYRGKKTDKIIVHAIDDFKVNEVLVKIFTPTLELLEGGRAECQADGLHWVYKTTLINKDRKGCKITAMAYDLPGNESVMQITL